MSDARTFIDEQGRPWTLRVDVAIARRARDQLGIDLTEIYSGDLAIRLSRDPVLLVDLLELVAAPEIDSESFARAVGHKLPEAAEALIHALADFFDGLTSGAASRVATTTLETLRRAETIAMDKLKVPSDAEIEATIDDVLAKLISGGGSTKPPASSASTPIGSPPGSSV